MIEINSKMSSPDGRFKGILFGDLFNIYNSISNKVRTLTTVLTVN